MEAKTKKPGRIPELDGVRVLMIFIVSWFHIWQQSWLEPRIEIPALGIRWSLDFLVRTGYVWVDGTVLLSAFLLYLPLARKGREPLQDIPGFYRRKARRILPGYWFVILLIFFAVCLPWNMYGANGPFLVKDLFTHFTMTFTFFRDTYLYSPLGGAFWTAAIVTQGYLLFPLLSRGMHRHPARTAVCMALGAWAFRAWCLWGLSEYSMVVNALPNFLDVYALGFGCALLYAELEKTEGDSAGRADFLREDRFRHLASLAATLVFFGCLIAVCELLKVQAHNIDYPALQGHQMIYRPLFALGFAGMILSAPFSVKPLRALLGNRVTAFLAAVSMNYYLTHQTLAVHLKRLRIPYSLSDTPNMVGEQPWQIHYTLLAFGLSLVLAAAITYLVEKPVRRLLAKREAQKNKG